jgi:hypothetical protein
MIVLVRPGKLPMTPCSAAGGCEGQPGVSLPRVTSRRPCDMRYPPICIAIVSSIWLAVGHAEPAIMCPMTVVTSWNIAGL